MQIYLGTGCVPAVRPLFIHLFVLEISTTTPPHPPSTPTTFGSATNVTTQLFCLSFKGRNNNKQGEIVDFTGLANGTCYVCREI